MGNKKLVITTEVYGDEIRDWLNRSQTLTLEQKEELITKSKVSLKRNDNSYTTYELFETTELK